MLADAAPALPTLPPGSPWWAFLLFGGLAAAYQIGGATGDWLRYLLAQRKAKDAEKPALPAPAPMCDPEELKAAVRTQLDALRVHVAAAAMEGASRTKAPTADTINAIDRHVNGLLRLAEEHRDGLNDVATRVAVVEALLSRKG